MDDKMTQKNEEMEIDLQRLFRALVGKAWLIVLVSVLCAVAVFLGTLFFVTPLYKSSAMFYVNNSSLSLGETSLSISSSDISASRGLVKTYIVILNTREVINDVIDYADVDRTYTEIKGMISAAAVDSTEIFEVVVTSPDPAEAEQIADAIAHILPKRITNIIEGTSARVVDSAVMASRPSSPNYTKNTMVGFMIGLVLAAALVIVWELMDSTIRTEEDIAQTVKHPVLASVPDMQNNPHGGQNKYAYGYGKKKYRQKDTSGDVKKDPLVGSHINFAAAEAYKLLRTKLQFSFADEKNCRIIGVSSALPGEGKSLTAVNLACSLSELDKRVLLVECDLRRPSVFEKLPVKRYPGLSEYLSCQNGNETIFQNCGITGQESAFHVITAGRIPPNPMELLSSNRMSQMVDVLREKYDYIVLDLPPVIEVSDALAVSKLTDGMLLVVRQNYCDRVVLSTTVRQFASVKAKVLGIVVNGATEGAGGIGDKYYKRYYKRYSKKYRYGYGYHYGNTKNTRKTGRPENTNRK